MQKTPHIHIDTKNIVHILLTSNISYIKINKYKLKENKISRA